MRKNKSASSATNALSCSTTPYTDCPNTQRQRITDQICSFTNCNFTSVSNTGHTSENGGAICYEVANGNLIVTSCSFSHCIAYSKEGGGIYCNNAAYVSVSSSAFSVCAAHAHTGGSGGGGITLRQIQIHPQISLCTFISCSSEDDGGGVAV